MNADEDERPPWLHIWVGTVPMAILFREKLGNIISWIIDKQGRMYVLVKKEFVGSDLCHSAPQILLLWILVHCWHFGIL